MSNNRMVSVPSGWLYRINPDIPSSNWQFTQDAEHAESLSRSENVEYVKLPTEQGEPVALPELLSRDDVAHPKHMYIADGFRAGMQWMRSAVEKLGQLYTHPAPAVQQGEPLAWLHEMQNGKSLSFNRTAHDNVESYPLYTHAHVCEKCRGVHCSKTACVVEIATERDTWKAASQANKDSADAYEQELAKLRKLHDSVCAKLAERDALLRKALASCDEATAAFEDDPNGPGQWTCHACYAYTNAGWHHGKIVNGGPKEIAHELDCWAEQARKLLSASAETSEQNESDLDDFFLQVRADQDRSDYFDSLDDSEVKP